MYNLPHHKEQDSEKVLDFVRQHPFAMLVGAFSNGKPVATQIPVFIEERAGKLYLSGHMMRKMDHHLAFEENPQVLCVFSGAHSYVSATWYENPQQASTWNYQSVHVRGRMSFLDGAALIDVLQKTSLHFEGGNKSSSTVYENLPPEYTSRLLKAIVAFEVEVEEIQHVFKLSQDRDQHSYRNIVGELKKGDADAQKIADTMEAREEQVYPRH
ncbi:MAG: FMN-binding negative transcriptional regulator [Chitinophagaceae bacterium]|nr:MAG: FMN-binding negative transcriptional regulator [Chitinophagaceae bacterium]